MVWIYIHYICFSNIQFPLSMQTIFKQLSNRNINHITFFDKPAISTWDWRLLVRKTRGGLMLHHSPLWRSFPTMIYGFQCNSSNSAWTSVEVRVTWPWWLYSRRRGQAFAAFKGLTNLYTSQSVHKFFSLCKFPSSTYESFWDELYQLLVRIKRA